MVHRPKLPPGYELDEEQGEYEIHYLHEWCDGVRQATHDQAVAWCWAEFAKELSAQLLAPGEAFDIESNPGAAAWVAYADAQAARAVAAEEARDAALKRLEAVGWPLSS